MIDAATWWKDRDKWLPGVGHEPPAPGQSDEDPDFPHEDIGDIADDDSEELDDEELPDRGADV